MSRDTADVGHVQSLLVLATTHSLIVEQFCMRNLWSIHPGHRGEQFLAAYREQLSIFLISLNDENYNSIVARYLLWSYSTASNCGAGSSGLVMGYQIRGG